MIVPNPAVQIDEACEARNIRRKGAPWEPARCWRMAYDVTSSGAWCYWVRFERRGKSGRTIGATVWADFIRRAS